jgi:hypothetical protein
MERIKRDGAIRESKMGAVNPLPKVGIERIVAVLPYCIFWIITPQAFHLRHYLQAVDCNWLHLVILLALAYHHVFVGL